MAKCSQRFVRRKRGVIIDAANGGNHWSFKVAEKAIAEGFYPDIISTDLTVKTLFKDPVFSMPYLMSKYLFLKMPLPEIIARCTSIPAKIMGMESEIGQLQEGFLADVAILKRCDKYICFSDTQKETRIGREVTCTAADYYRWRNCVSQYFFMRGVLV